MTASQPPPPAPVPVATVVLPARKVPPKPPRKPAFKPPRKAAFKPAVVKARPAAKPKPRPVATPCYALTVAPHSLRASSGTELRVRVTAKRAPVAGVKIEVKGAGILKLSGRTSAAGRVTLVLNLHRPGILVVKPAFHQGCGATRIGVVGDFTPPVTG